MLTGPLRPTNLRPRTSLTGSIPTSRSEVAARLNNDRRTSLRPGHPFSRAVAACQSRLLSAATPFAIPQRCSTDARLFTVEALRAAMGKVPLTNLCSRFCCHEDPSNPQLSSPPAFTFGPTQPRLALCRTRCVQRTCTFQTSPDVVDAGSPEGVSSPEWCRDWRRVHQLRPCLSNP